MDVTGEGIEAPRDDIDGAQLGPVPLPGLQVLHAINADGDLDGCTLGPAIRSVDGSRSGFLTAGHCGLGPYASEQYYQPTAAGEPEFLATATGAENDEAAGIDSAALWVPGGIGPRATRVAGFPVDRVMSAAEVRSSLPVGTPVCVNGARAGVKCSALAKIPTSTILYGEVTHTGDSGAPVFVVDAETRRAIVIGIHEAVNGGYSEATFAEPALARLGAELATAP